ncbi:unnamed protein product [Microthlaspi erraticum]|uniref:Uncharacterized protein n=1 Tax=Microthlaspi erraticum TaxID=1685480 RepID=A0A6D2IAH8_9BRAS|nr:unnamed protein product [Microthlaspi erraticum]
MENRDACGGATWASKIHPGWGLPHEQLTFRGDFDEASQHHVIYGGKFAALIQKYETALRAAKDEVSKMQWEHEKAKDVDAMSSRYGGEAEGSGCRSGGEVPWDAEVVAAEVVAPEVGRLCWSRQEWAVVAALQVYNSVNDWYVPRLRRLSDFVTQQDAVEAAVGRRQVDEALLDFVRKIRGVDLDFDAVERMLEARLAKSIADGDSIDEVIIDDDDFAKPCGLSMSELTLPKSPSRRDDTSPGAGLSASGAKSA